MAEITIHSKYDIGDKIYYITKQPIQYPCHGCNSTGQISYDGHIFKCSNCHGKGYIELDSKTYSVTGRGIISGISAGSFTNVNHETTVEFDYYIDNIYGSDDRFTVRRYDTDVFDTLEEAQAECDRRNK